MCSTTPILMRCKIDKTMERNINVSRLVVVAGPCSLFQYFHLNYNYISLRENAIKKFSIEPSKHSHSGREWKHAGGVV